jgi:hypothetical protein
MNVTSSLLMSQPGCHGIESLIYGWVYYAVEKEKGVARGDEWLWHVAIQIHQILQKGVLLPGSKRPSQQIHSLNFTKRTHAKISLAAAHY